MGSDKKETIDFWLNTTYACAGVTTDKWGVIIETAPIYKKFKSRKITEVVKELVETKKLLDIKATK